MATAAAAAAPRRAPDAAGDGAAVTVGADTMATPVTAGAPAATRPVFSEVRNVDDVAAAVTEALAALAALADAVVTVKATVTPLCSRWRPADAVAVTLVMVMALVATDSCDAMDATNAACAAGTLNCATVMPCRLIEAATTNVAAAGEGVPAAGDAGHVGMGMGPMKPM